MMMYVAVLIMVIIVTLIIIYMFPLALVQGNSMLPILKHNEVLVMRRKLPREKPKVGKIYVYKKPNKDLLVIKRLTDYIPMTEECYFLGDNPEESYDSRDYGYINAENIIAVLLWNSKHQLKQKGEKDEKAN